MFIPFFNLGFMSNSLVFMLCYVWSKNFATTPCSLYGLMTIQVLPVRMLTCISCRSVDRLPFHMLHDSARHQNQYYSDASSRIWRRASTCRLCLWPSGGLCVKLSAN